MSSCVSRSIPIRACATWRRSVGITERAVQKIVDDLDEAGILTRERSGRRNSYRLNVNVPLRHPLESHRTVGSLLSMVLDRNAIKRIPSV